MKKLVQLARHKDHYDLIIGGEVVGKFPTVEAATHWVKTNYRKTFTEGGFPYIRPKAGKKNPGFGSSKDLYSAIRVGDTVTIKTPHGSLLKGKATMKGPAGWVLNLGGKHGTPGIANDTNIVKVSKRKINPATGRVRNIARGTTIGTGPNRKFFPWRSSPDYDPTRLSGPEGKAARRAKREGKKVKKYSVKRGAAKKRTAARGRKAIKAAYSSPGTQGVGIKGRRLAAYEKYAKSSNPSGDGYALYRFKIDGMPTEAKFKSMPFARQIDHRLAFADFRKSANHTYVSAKGKSIAKAFAEWKAKNKPAQWFYVNTDWPGYHDDSFEVWYKGAKSSNPRTPSVASVLKEIRALGLKASYDRDVQEFRITKHSASAKRAESMAYYTSDAVDALGTARKMAGKSNPWHGGTQPERGKDYIGAAGWNTLWKGSVIDAESLVNQLTRLHGIEAKTFKVGKQTAVKIKLKDAVKAKHVLHAFKNKKQNPGKRKIPAAFKAAAERAKAMTPAQRAAWAKKMQAARKAAAKRRK